MLCSICNSNSVEEIATIDGYRETSSYTVNECGACGTSSVRPCELDARIYEAIYRNVKDVPGYSRYYSLANDIERQTDPLNYIANVEEPYFAVIDVLRTQFARGDHLEICEVGCGQGYFTFALRKAGFSATGVDHSEVAIELAQRRYGDFYFCGNLPNYIARLQERPQLIFACEVIEHLEDPIGFVSEALECLPSGGILAITTPNKLQYGSQSAQRFVWDTELPPVHLWWFTKNSFVEMSKRLNCSVSFSDFTKFYQLNERFFVSESGTAAARSPILDKDYNLIQFAHAGDGLARLKNILKGLLPSAVTRKLRRLRAARGGVLRYRDDDTSTTIGVHFKKK
jgi:2-polyprenyl-3-methyl-5-hydroxy-6-metoxy-1,4-benzoquinol methylase